MKEYTYGKACNFSIPELRIILDQKNKDILFEYDPQEKEFLELQIEELELELAMLEGDDPYSYSM